MSSDKSYIRNISNKYRLAVAIAVLKEKPENLSIDKYIEELKNKINEKNMEDLDLTICSDDFDIDENDTNILDRCDNGSDRCISYASNENNERVIVINNDLANDRNQKHDRNFNDYDTLLGNNENIIIHKENIIISKNDETCLSTHYEDNRRSKMRKEINNMNTSCSRDSETILKDIDINNLIANEISINARSSEVTNNNSFAGEHDYALQPDRQIVQPRINTDLIIPVVENATNNSFNNNPSKLNEKGFAIILNEAANEVQFVNNNTANLENPIPPSNGISRENCIENIPETYFDSQATEIYSVHGFSQNYTHVSQSQNHEQMVVNNKFIKSKSNIFKARTEDMETRESENINTITDDLMVNVDLNQNDENNLLDNNLFIEDLDTNFQSHMPTMLVNQNSMAKNETFPQYAQHISEFNEERSEVEINEAVINVNESNRDVDMNEEEEISNAEEIVSFKVVEELNKVKNYINRRVERRMSNDGSIDSGYKSDSQKSFRSSLQLSGNWVNQSAHSLYEYIAQCPLLNTAQEIVNEIAQVLGQLIDKLHEEEKYPTFLEELLENVDYILQEVFHGTGGDDVLLKKDENIQRLLLINKSVHIQKYTIEKIAIILEDIHNHLTNPEDMYEINHTTEIENLTYIFHILEVLLQRYSKNKPLASQEMTNSQTELKASSIADIWRKKWNPKYKEESIVEDFSQKKCVLLKCNEVLNKLIVSCMEGYSLVAFSALQCFNLLQT